MTNLEDTSEKIEFKELAHLQNQNLKNFEIEVVKEVKNPSECRNDFDQNESTNFMMSDGDVNVLKESYLESIELE